MQIADTSGDAAMPLKNCVFISSSERTTIYNGTAEGHTEYGGSTTHLELRYAAADGNASVTSTFPLKLSLPPSNVTASKSATLHIQVPRDAAGVGVHLATLDVVLYLSGSEPSFEIGGCRSG